MQQAISNRYAQALADSVFAPGANVDAAQISQELHDFENMFRSVPELRTVMLSPAVSTVRKRGLIERYAQTLPLARIFRNFLFVLVDRRRINLLGEIARAFDTAVDERLGLVRAEVVSAAPLSDERKSEIEAALSEVSGRRVRCRFEIDPSLIGGITARIGSTVYDGSVRTQLQTMRSVLIS